MGHCLLVCCLAVSLFHAQLPLFFSLGHLLRNIATLSDFTFPLHHQSKQSPTKIPIGDYDLRQYIFGNTSIMLDHVTVTDNAK